MTETVSFTQMKHGSKADYELLQRLEDEFCQSLPDRLLTALRRAGAYAGRLSGQPPRAFAAVGDARL